jgi:hypothetical protein
MLLNDGANLKIGGARMLNCSCERRLHDEFHTTAKTVRKLNRRENETTSELTVEDCSNMS